MADAREPRPAEPVDAPAHGPLRRTRLMAIARKEWIQLRRDPRSLILAFAMPVFLLVLFGYAITWDVRNIEMVVVDQDRTAQSRELVEAFTASGYFQVVERLDRTAEIARVFERGAARVAIVLPPGFEAALGTARPSPAAGDRGRRPTRTRRRSRSATCAPWRSSGAGREGLLGTATRMPVVAQSRVWYNEELASRNMIVPGLVAVIMSIIAAMLTSLTIAREWERGTMEQLAATPVSRAEVVLGKLLPYLAIGMIDVVVTSVLGVLALRGAVPRRRAALRRALVPVPARARWGSASSSRPSRSRRCSPPRSPWSSRSCPRSCSRASCSRSTSCRRRCRRSLLIVPARYFLVVTRGVFLKGVGARSAVVAGAASCWRSRPSASGWPCARSARSCR